MKTKSEIYAKVKAMRDADPDISQAEIARQLDRSRERIRQILNELEYVPVPDKTKEYQCLSPSCGKTILINGYVRPNFRAFCDNECRKTYHSMTLTCSFCNETFTVLKSVGRARIERNQSGLFFCSKTCQGYLIARDYGFGLKEKVTLT